MDLTEHSSGRYTDGSVAERARSGTSGYGATVLSRRGAERSKTRLRHTRKRDVGAPRRRAAQRNAAERRERTVGWAGTIEPEVVPVEPAEPGRPEAEQRSTAEAEAGAGRQGCCAASVPILSLRRFGGSERSLGLTAAKAGAANTLARSALEGNLRKRSPPGADGKQALRATVAGAATAAEEGRSGSRLPGRERSENRAGGQSAQGADAGVPVTEPAEWPADGGNGLAG